MGSGHTKDGFVDIFLQTTQAIYVAGSYVEGTVYINCKDRRNYRTVNLKLQGVQHVYWSQGSGKNRRTYKNTKNTYQASFQLAVFAEGIIPGGHYAFPFRFILPSQLSGSHFESQNCYIRYPLTAELVSSDGQNDNQIYTKNLNILQPVRQLSGIIQKQQISSPQCCGCCADYGVVKVVMSCDKNFVRSGDVINVSGFIDNSGGKQDVTNCHISFQDIRWKISSGGAVRRHILGDHPLFVIPQPVGKGQTRQFSFTATIPQGLIFSTAIGSILSRYQVLNFSGEIGCCTGGATCQFLLVFHTGTQQIEVAKKVPPPPGWMPKVAPEVLCTTLPPFHYHPTLGIPYTNRAGTTNITNLNVMATQDGYYSGNVESNTFTNVQKMY